MLLAHNERQIFDQLFPASQHRFKFAISNNESSVKTTYLLVMPLNKNVVWSILWYINPAKRKMWMEKHFWREI